VSPERSDRARILVLIKGLGIGGAERLIADAASFWDRTRFDYRVAFMLPHKDQLVAELEEQGIGVTSLGGDEPRLTLGAVRRMRALFEDWQPDLVHAHLPSAGILARLLFKGPVVYTEHNLADSYRQPTRWLNRATYGRNASVLAVSDAVAESLRGFPGPKPVVVPNGVSVNVDASDVAEIRNELGLEPSDPLVVHVGNIRPHKGHSNLIAATAKMVAERPEVRVVSVGGEKFPGDLGRVRAEAEAAGVGKALEFMGRRPDALAFIAAADVFVNPADVEGLPVVILEALALGRPVVATEVGGVPSVVIDGVTGKLVPPRDPVALAGAILEALDTPQARKWGETGRELILRDHGTDRMVHSYEETYQGLIGG
jgi:glycosyltransferase involved in cell wall biosynthesis